MSGDGRTYTFTLRTGVTFHDGSAWDADAALFNFRRMFDKSFHYYYPLANSTVSPFIGGIADYDAPDSHTLRDPADKGQRRVVRLPHGGSDILHGESGRSHEAR